MQNLERLNLLIDKAAAIHGSDNKLAEELGITRINVSKWRHGKAKPSDKQTRRMAEIAGLDPAEQLLWAAAEEKDDPSVIKLVQELFKNMRREVTSFYLRNVLEDHLPRPSTR